MIAKEKNKSGFRLAIAILLMAGFCLAHTRGLAQPWIYDFGTGTGSYPSGTTQTINILSSTPTNGGTYRLRTGTAGGGFTFANPGTSLGSATELQLNASTSTSTNKFTIFGWNSPSAVAYLRAKVRTSSSGGGNLVIQLGDGGTGSTTGSDNQEFNKGYNNSLTSLLLKYTSGVLTVFHRIPSSGGTDVAISTPGFAKDADQSIEIYANNASTSATYFKLGSNTLSAQSWDLWVDGVKISTSGGWGTAGTWGAGNNISGVGFFAESSASNAAYFYIDDIEYSNALPTSSAPSVTTSAATSISSTSATLNGLVNANNASSTVNFNYGLTTSYGSNATAAQSPLAGTSPTSVSATVSGLSANTFYNFREAATNASGATAGSNLTFYTLANTPSAPVVSNAMYNSLDLMLGTGDGNPSSTSYALFEITTGLYVQSDGTLGASAVWQTATTWAAKTVSGLTSGTTYTFQAKARNDALTPVETSFGTSASLATLSCSAAPAAPTNPSVSNITNSGVTVSWIGGSTDFEYAVITSPTPPTSGTAISSTTDFASGLASSTNYYLHVRSKCGSYYSAWVTSEPFTTLDPPTGLITWVPSGLSSYGPSPWTYTTGDSRLNVGGLTRGAGVTTTGSSIAANAWGGNTWTGGTTEDITFTVEAKTGYKVSLSSFNLSYRRSSTGPTTGVLQYTINNGAYADIATFSFSSTSAAGGSLSTINLSGTAALQDVQNGSVVKFRILPSGGTASQGTWYVYNQGLSLNGTVASVVTVPVAVAATSVYPTCFTASWNSVANATTYYLDVYTDGFSTDPNSTTVAGWDFGSSLACNSGTASNIGSLITAKGGTNAAAISSNTARATGWDAGSGAKYWEVIFSTTNYYNLKLSSAQRSSDNGPRDFKIQYKIGAGGTYADLPGGLVTTANNYTSGVVSNLALPAACENQATVYVRWIMTSNTAVNSGAVTGLGASNISDVSIAGNVGLNTVYVTGYQNASVGNVTSKQVTGLSASTTYYYVVRSVVSGVTSNNSNVVTASTITSAAAAYRSRQTGLWNSPSTWEYETCSGSWITATAAPSSANDMTIMSGHTVTLDVAPSIGTGKTLSVASGGVLATGSYVVSGAGSFNLLSGGTLSIGSAGGIAASANAGNIQVSGSRTYNSGANFIYAGTTNQAAGDGLPSVVASLSVNNTGTAGNNVVSISNDLQVTTVLSFTKGVISTGANSIAIPSSGSVNGASANTGWIAGNLKKWLSLSGASTTYETGDPTAYRPVVVNFTNIAAPGYLTATVSQTSSQHPSVAGSGIDKTKDVARYYTLVSSGGFVASGAYEVTFNYVNPTDIIGGANANSFVVRRYNGTSWATTSSNPINTGSSTTVTPAGFAANSTYDFVVGECLQENVSGLALTAANGCAGGGAMVNINAPNLANGSYAVVYDLSGDNVVANVGKTVTITNGVGTFTTDPLANSGSTTTITVKSLQASGIPSCPTTLSSGNTATFSSNASNIWTGASSGDWNTAANWSCGAVPAVTDDIVIPSGASSFPALSSPAVGTVHNLTVNSGASLTVTGKLKIGGAIANSGTFSASAGTIELNGTSLQTIPSGTFSTNTVENLIASNNVTLGGTLNITGALTFGGSGNTFTSNGNLVVKSSLTATARVGDLTGNTVVGNVTVERYIPAFTSRRYRLLTAPVMNTSINSAWQEGRTWNGGSAESSTGYGTLITGPQQSTAAGANGSGFDFWPAIASQQGSVRYYLPGASGSASSWQPLYSTLDATAFNNLQAYLLWVRGDRSVSAGTNPYSTTLRATGPLKQGTFSVTIPVSNAYTLLGNPYASPLDFLSVYNDNAAGIENLFWVWQAQYGTSTGGYLLVKPTGSGSYEAIPEPFTQNPTGGSPANRLIHSGQGFFVVPKAFDAASSGSFSLSIKESQKSSGTPAVSVFRQQGALPAKLYLNVSTGQGGKKVLLDGVLATYHESYAAEKESVAKAVNGGENISIPFEDKDLIVSAQLLPKTGDVLPLKFWNTTERRYLIELRGQNFSTAGLQAFLQDKYLGTETPVSLLGDVTAYEFTVTSDTASKDPYRFSVLYRGVAVLPLAAINIRAQEENRGVIVEWEVEDEALVKAYEVERACGTNAFQTIALVTARNQASRQAYVFYDSVPATINRYRIKAIGKNEAQQYSSTVSVQLQKERGSITLQTNPVYDKNFALLLANEVKGSYSLKLYNSLGNLVATKTFVHPGGNSTRRFSIQDTRPAGVYWLLVKSPGGEKTTLKLVSVR